MSKVLHAARLVIIIAMISLLLGELTLRTYNMFNPLFIFYDNSYNRFRGKPFADDWDFKLNSLGFKDVEFSREKNRNYRIVGIGDSFAYGVVPYKDNYLTRLEEQLRQESLNVEVFNMGIPSTGPKEYLSLLMREGLAFKPDMVLLSLFVGNDFIESRKSRKWYTYSYVASLFHYVLTLRRKYEGHIIHGNGQYCDDCPNFDEATFLKTETDRGFIYVTDNQDFVSLFDKALDSLAQIQAVCQKHGIKLVVVIIPDEIQVNPALAAEVRKQLAVRDGAWNITQPNEKLAEKFKPIGVDYLDLYPDFAKQAQAQRLYRPRDTHWNIAGNQLAADIIQNHIRHYVIPSADAKK